MSDAQRSAYTSELAEAYEEGFGVGAQYISLGTTPEGVPPIEIGLYPPTDDRPVFKVVTLGMGARPLEDPESGEVRVELGMSLPAAWGEDAEGDGGLGTWPLEQLLTWASFPHQEDTFVWIGHTLAGQPIEPMDESTDFVGWMVIDPFFTPSEIISTELGEVSGGEPVEMLDLLPLYAEELEFAIDEGSGALFERMKEAQLPPLVADGRPNVCG